MKGAGTLVSLVLVAVAAGILLVLNKPAEPASETTRDDRSPHEAYVEETLGLSFLAAPMVRLVSSEVLIREVEENLDEQFGPGGLARRTRALDLLGFEDLRQRNLRDEMISLEAAGVRGWFNTRTGHILLPADFDEAKVPDMVILRGLLTRLLVHQHSPPTIGTLADDEWIARRGLHAAIAESVEAKLRAENRSVFELPTSQQTEREAVIASLPTYLFPLGGLHWENGPARVFLETRIRTGARTLADLIKEPPSSTLELLGADPGAVVPVRLPVGLTGGATDNELLFEESLGALGIHTLIEWIDSYEQAQALALLWRGDRYRLLANGSGDHLVWVCQWETPAAAARAAELLSARQDREPASRRFYSVFARGRTTILVNCADRETMENVVQMDW
jgi:hypothetical protein